MAAGRGPASSAGARRFASTSTAAYAAPAAGWRLAPLMAGAVAAAAACTYTLSEAAAAPATSRAQYHRTLDSIPFDRIREAIAEVLYNEATGEYEHGPLIVRLAWHASGTYDAASGTGGSDGSTMRFPSEAGDPANAGLHHARDLLEPIKAEFPEISYADLWTLAGAVAIELMGGPHVPWQPGRIDAMSSSSVPPRGRLPDAALGADHVRAVFGRMGFNDREMVALIGAHALGRCHTDRSGFDGPWTFSPHMFSNDFYRLLLDEEWTVRRWKGPKQYEDKSSKSLMMLPTDMVLVQDSSFRAFVELYAEDEDVFFADFAAAFSKLLALGVRFPQ